MERARIDPQHNTVNIGEECGITGPQNIPIDHSCGDPPDTSNCGPQFRFTGGHESGNDNEEKQQTDGQETDDSDTLALLHLNTILRGLGGRRGTVNIGRVRDEIGQIEHRQRNPHTGYRRVLTAGNRNHRTGLNHGGAGYSADVERFGHKILHRQCQNRHDDTADGNQDPRYTPQCHPSNEEGQGHRVRKVTQDSAQ